MPVSKRSTTFAEKTMEKKWITTEQMIDNLKINTNYVHEYDLWLSNGYLISTHWVVYDSKN